MTYQFKLIIFKWLERNRKWLRRFGWNPKIPDNRDMIRKYVPDKSFVDIGCLWGVHGEYCFFAEDHGASDVLGVDVYPPTDEFAKKHKDRSSKVDLLQGDINDPATIKAIGRRDVVFFSGVLYHLPNPVSTLCLLRQICGETLILYTQSIPEFPGVRNVNVYYPGLPSSQRGLWDRRMGRQRGITGPFEPEEGYGNWFWGFTPSGLEGMLQSAGFSVREAHYHPFSCLLVCSPDLEMGCQPVSGSYSTPNDQNFLRHGSNRSIST